jgi:hypothetical protein
MKFVVQGRRFRPLSGLLTALLVCSYAASAENSAKTKLLLVQGAGAPVKAPATPTGAGAGAGSPTGAAQPTTTTPTVSQSKKQKKHKKRKAVKLKKQKPKKHHKVKHPQQRAVHGSALQAGVTHVHKHKPLSSSQSSRLQKLENAISNPSSSQSANTSKIGTPGNSLPGVSP